MTRITVYDDFSLEKIAHSGQCFRAGRCRDGSYQFISGEHVIRIRETDAGIPGKTNVPERVHEPGKTDVPERVHEPEKTGAPVNGSCFTVSCSEEMWNEFWKGYFDLDRNYSQIRMWCAEKFSDECDETRQFLEAAEEAGRGLRILRQDPWEMLITFIISQRKNMPAIAAAVEKLSVLYGHRIPEDDLIAQGLSPENEWPIYTFPDPEELDRASEQDLRDAGMGYRAPYIRDAVDKIMSGELDLKQMEELDDQALFDKLLTVKGIGKKVANCICLFGFGRTGRSPVDVWIDRAIGECGGEDPFPQFGDYAGIMQQYAFYHMTHREK